VFDWKEPSYDAVFAERAERLQRLRDDPSLIGPLKAYYKTHPVEFITEWGMTFDPRNSEIGMPPVVPFVLFERQEEFLDWLLERWRGREDGLVEKSRDMGVSWLCVAFGVCMWLFQPGSVVGFGSRKEEYVDKIGDPKSLFWKVRQFINLLPHEFRPRVGARPSTRRTCGC
jgi:phage terminase large subunit